MAINSLFLLCVAVAALMGRSCHGDSGNDCIDIDAGFRYNDKVYLLSGDQYFQLNSSNREEQSGKIKDLFGGLEGEVDAAVVWPRNDYLYFFQGPQYYFYSSYSESTYGPYSNSYWTPFIENGIDAVGRLGDTTYFFKGCQYVVHSGSYSDAKSLNEIGLPCNVDAAWDEGDFMVVSKGDKSWTISSSDTVKVKGPFSLNEEIDLKSNTICKRGAAAEFRARVEAELEYEKDKKCVIIDAAITYKDTVYLFNNGSYITLDKNGQEVQIDDIGGWGGLRDTVDAGIVWSDNGRTYFFRGPKYYTYSFIIFGPFSNNKWAPFFAEGIDAAGNHQGKSFFFKGCQVAQYGPGSKVVETFDNEDLKLPCDLDAAFSRGDDLYAVKGDQVWKWSDVVTGPSPLSDEVTLNSWTVCSAQ